MSLSNHISNNPLRRAASYNAASNLLLKELFLLLGYLTLTQFNRVLIREARQIEAKSYHFDHGIAVHMN
jgi:hypothetical protein